jgi:hypothetical protein
MKILQPCESIIFFSQNVKQDGDPSVFIYTLPFHNKDISYYDIRYAYQTCYGCTYIFVKILHTKNWQ